MTDESYVYSQDIKERKSMRTGAFHKRCGSKSKKCTMPSDYLSRKEKRKMNGNVVSINLGKPITNFGEFKTYSISMQQLYLQNLVDKYGARKTDIIEMLGTTYTTFQKYIDSQKLDVKFANSKKHLPDDRFVNFIHQSDEKTLEAQKKREDEILKERFGIDISSEGKKVKDNPSDQSTKQDFELKDDHVNPYTSKADEFPIHLDKEHPACQVGEAHALYLKAFYVKLIAVGFSDDFAKSLTLERCKTDINV